MWIGEFSAGDTIDFKFTTRTTTGAPTTLAGSPALSVYKGNGTTESTAGVTLTVDFDSRTGLNHVRITTASDGAFYADGQDFAIVITAGTVGGVSVVGEVVGHFTLRNRAALKPTTSGRTLDVSAGGEAGVDWANVGSPTTTLNLSGTTVKTATDVETDTQDIQSRLPAALVSGRMDSNVQAMADDVITAAKIAADAITSSELATSAVQEIADALLDRSDGIETGETLRQALRLIRAVLVGKSSLSGTTRTYRDKGDTKNRISATTDSNGQRTAVTTDAT